MKFGSSWRSKYEYEPIEEDESVVTTSTSIAEDHEGDVESDVIEDCIENGVVSRTRPSGGDVDTGLEEGMDSCRKR